MVCSDRILSFFSKLLNMLLFFKIASYLVWFLAQVLRDSIIGRGLIAFFGDICHSLFVSLADSPVHVTQMT